MTQSVALTTKQTFLNTLQQYVRKDEIDQAGKERINTFTPTNGQTAFNLTATAVQPQLSKLFLNGVKYRFGIDYSINASVLNWLSAIPLGNSDLLEIIYYS